MRFSRLVCCIGRFRGWISRFGRSLVVWSGGLVVSRSTLVVSLSVLVGLQNLRSLSTLKKLPLPDIKG
jgi:hypothetical protein